ncbi:MAG: hypothetical protein Q8N31_25380 [Reyranella sp.]|nr:hypothetical protein [Reyranella sp.]MDP3163359.1 hypothetical protein [Reyranella sp.]
MDSFIQHYWMGWVAISAASLLSFSAALFATYTWAGPDSWYAPLIVGAAAWVSLQWHRRLAIRKVWRTFIAIDARKWSALNFDELKVGDIIATRHGGKSSRLVRRHIGGEYSHVAIYIGDGKICEAVLPRARIVSADNHTTTSDEDGVCVLRLRSESVDQTRLVNEARFYAWNLYSVSKALRFKVAGAAALASRDSNICSELVAEVYRRVGHDLCPGIPPSHTNPQHIVTSASLVNVTPTCRVSLNADEAQSVLRAALGRSGPIRTLVLPWLRWVGALIYSISFLRSAWAKPMRSWNTLEFWTFYIYTAILILKLAVTSLGLRISAGPTRYLYRKATAEERTYMQEQVAGWLKFNQEVLQVDERAGKNWPAEVPARWTRRFDALWRINARLRRWRIVHLQATLNSWT